MAKRAAEVPPWLSLDDSSGAPYYRQLYEGMRREILSGMLLAGTRLPSTRTLAAELGVSRTTVVTAFDQLLAEGYLEGRVGWLPEGVDDREASRRAANRGVEAPPISSAPRDSGALMLGYAAVGEGEMRGAVQRLAEALG